MKLIPLTRGYVAMVDDEDFDRLNLFNWQASVRKTGVYAKRFARIGGKRTWVYMHREVLHFRALSPDVDHINHNPLDNQKSNLRPATHQQNHRNQKPRKGTSRYKGVFFMKNREKWRAYAVMSGKQIHLGVFVSEKEAAKSYDIFAKEHFGEYACLNNPK